jgi:hypothetical protein
MAYCPGKLGPVDIWARGMRLVLAFVLGIWFVFCGGAASALAQGNTSTADRADVLRGTVVNGVTREPIGRALVLSPDNRFATMTDDRGRFEFTIPRPEGDRADQAFVAPGAPGAQMRPAQQPPNNRPNFLTARKTGFLFDNNGMQGVSIGPDQQDVTIEMAPEARIVGHVLLPGSEGANGMRVDLYRRQVQDGRARWDQAGTVTARSDGEFRLAELSAGSYKVFTQELLDRDPLTSNPRGQLFGYPPIYYPAASDFATAAVIRLTAGETFQASLTPVKREYYSVKLGIANAAVGVYPDVLVWRQGNEGPGYSLGYNPRDEAIEGLLPNGNYTVQVTSRGTAAMMGIANITVSSAPVSGAVVTLVPGTAIEVSVREEFQHPRASSTTTVTDEFRRSFTASERRPNYLQATLVPVEEFGRRQKYPLRPPTGPDDDALVFENVLPGRYRVRVEARVGYVASIRSESTDLQSLPLEVGFGASPPQIEITVRDDGADVQGSVAGLTNNGNRAGAFQSSAQIGGFVYFVPINDSGQMKQTWLGPDGNFRVQQLPPGTYRVLAFDHQRPELEFANEEVMSRYDSKAQVISVVAGQSENLQLTLITGNE